MKAKGTIRADPSHIFVTERFTPPSPVGITRLSWESHGTELVEVRVGSPDGPLLSRTGSNGSMTTGQWVHDGLTFYLQNVSQSLPLTQENTLATVTVSVELGKNSLPYYAWQEDYVHLRRSGFALEVSSGADGRSIQKGVLAGAESGVSFQPRRSSAPRDEQRGPSIVVLNGTPANNLGDDAMLICVVRDLQRLAPDAGITVLTENPASCEELQSQIDVPLMDSLQPYVQTILDFLPPQESAPALMRRLSEQFFLHREAVRSGRRILGLPPEFGLGLKALMAADGVVGCGVAIADEWKSYTYERCLDYLLAAKPLFVSGMGLDRLDLAEDSDLLAQALSQAYEITVREPLSEQRLRSLGCGSFFHTTGDDTVTLSPAGEPHVRETLAMSGLTGAQDYVAFQFRRYLDYTNERLVDRFAGYVDEVIAELGLPVVGVPMHFGPTDERRHLSEIRRRVRSKGRFHVVEKWLKPAEAKGLFGNAELTLGISYHSAIFSLSSGVPFIGVHRGGHYTQKMQGVAELYGLADLPVGVDSTPPAALRPIVRRAFDQRHSVSGHLKSLQQRLSGEVIESRRRFLTKVRQAMRSSNSPEPQRTAETEH